MTGGASLKSYFVGRCLMEVPDVYARWDHDQRRRRRQFGSLDQISTGRLHDPAQAGVDAAVIEEAFRGQDSTVCQGGTKRFRWGYRDAVN